MRNELAFLFDFVSPNAYLAEDVLRRHRLPIRYSPVSIGGIFKATGNQPPFAAFAAIPAKLDYVRREIRRFIIRHRIDAFRWNPHFPLNTIPLMRGYIAAERIGAAAIYRRAAFAAMWEQEQKLDDPDVMAAMLTKAGLDGAGLLAAASDPAIQAELTANTEAAAARGVFGLPSFFLGGELYFGKECLPEIIEACA
jgi:2-hydroxychromene-2-carboxylate isomerase